MALETTDQNDRRYVDIELSYVCKNQAEIDKVLKAINSFVETYGEGLQKSSINILGYSYKY